MRLDLKLIEQWINPESRVLDLGCGDGTLLLHLKNKQNVNGLGLEIDAANISKGIASGINIIEQNMDRGLSNFPDHSFDTVVLAHALQAVHNPHLVLEEMLRIGHEGIVTFPNFGHWACRLHLGTRGRMPVSKFMPFAWYETPNIHFCTVKDFEDLCAEKSIRILNRAMVSQSSNKSRLANKWSNLFASTAIYRITK